VYKKFRLFILREILAIQFDIYVNSGLD
jgi:hypothetical protein